jgi:hypothetical protein
MFCAFLTDLQPLFATPWPEFEGAKYAEYLENRLQLGVLQDPLQAAIDYCRTQPGRAR